MNLNRFSFFVFCGAVQFVLSRSINDRSLTSSAKDLPRLCVYRQDPSQYYPCVLNYIGLHSWSLYRCPNQSMFDEQTQQCLMKIPISDTFDQLATYQSTANVQFFRLASFILATPQPNEDPTLQSQRRLVSLPPIIEKLVDSITKSRRRRRRDINDNSHGILWSSGYPLMKIDNQQALSVEPKSLLNVESHDQKVTPISEDELKYKKICYFTNWSQHRPGLARFEPENIDPFLCTHITYAFVYIDEATSQLKPIESNYEDTFRRLSALKSLNPNLKIILGVGGWNMGSEIFSTLVRDPEKRRTFIFNSINFLHLYYFDGIEIDWEYPSARGGRVDDKIFFTIFLEEFKQAATAESIITGRTRLLLAAAVSADPEVVKNGYEVESLSKLLDYINIITYDFHGSWQNRTGLNAPLYRRYDESGHQGTLNQDFGVAVWLKGGASAHKLVLGVPLFARTFLLARADLNDLNSPTVGNGTEGPFTRTPGFLSYFEICLLQSDPSWQKRFVPDGSESEYMFRDRDWVSYETIENVRKRAAYVVANHLGGMFVWSLDMDDFSGVFCTNGTYPYVKHTLGLLPTYMPSYLQN